MPVFNDSESKSFTLLPDGDYVLTCTDMEIGISNGAKTAGAEKYSVTFTVPSPDGEVELRETFVDHKSVGWKIDLWLKGSGVKLTKGQSFSFRKDEAARNKVPWVNPLGLRCHARVTQEDYVTKDKRTVKVNRIAVFYTDKGILAPVAMAQVDENEPF